MNGRRDCVEDDASANTKAGSIPRNASAALLAMCATRHLLGPSVDEDVSLKTATK
jgi:hypothetical protein